MLPCLVSCRIQSFIQPYYFNLFILCVLSWHFLKKKFKLNKGHFIILGLGYQIREHWPVCIKVNIYTFDILRDYKMNIVNKLLFI